jgi:hypothetical protein
MPCLAKIYRALNSKDKESKNEYLACTGKYFTKLIVNTSLRAIKK